MIKAVTETKNLGGFLGRRHTKETLGILYIAVSDNESQIGVTPYHNQSS